jgi:glycyl-tRNA synthetase beta chain
MAELLLEILSEEIPARMQAGAAIDLKRLVTAGLKDAGLDFESAAAYVTPRRLALVVDGLAERQPDIREEKRGPQVGAPEKAVNGFLKSVGLTPDQCEQREIKGKTYYFAVIEKPGRATKEVAAAIMGETLGALPWPKSMRWGAGAARWVRPIHSVLSIFDGSEIPFQFAGIRSGNTTRGHRFLAPGEIKVKDFKDYEAKLKQAKVILDGAERRARIERDARALAKQAGLTLKADSGLLDEVAGLVEWPVALIGVIDEAFMAVPPDVLITAMRSHQKYFALEDEKGAMAPRFVTIADIETGDGGKDIIAGNERVLRARLADAKFFWDQDRKVKLESRVAKLSEITFHAALGTVAEKAGRMESLATELCEYIPGADRDKATRAAHLAKADLTTGMVGEFPELQGVMGRYYALNDEENSDVADAIGQHHSPAGPKDSCPTAPTAIAVALADKIDSLVAFFGINERPTGSRDPFALRRAALGVIRLIVENGLRLPLNDVIAAAAEPYPANVHLQATVDGELLVFFAERLKVQMRAHGVRHDLIAAAFAVDKPGGGREDDLVRLLARVEALTAFLETDDGADLLTAYKRASNIVHIEEKRDTRSYADAPNAGDFRQGEETALHAGLGAAMKASSVALKGEDFTAVMAALAKLRAPVDAFFDEVTVNCDDEKLRQNRLRLLSQIRATLGNVADFSRIEG